MSGACVTGSYRLGYCDDEVGFWTDVTFVADGIDLASGWLRLTNPLLTIENHGMRPVVERRTGTYAVAARNVRRLEYVDRCQQEPTLVMFGVEAA